MLKKLVNKRIETFKEKFPDYEVSKNGNIYCRIGVQEIERKIKLTELGVTKNTINKLGSVKEFKEKKSNAVYLITKQGKLMVRNATNRFSNLSLRTIQNQYGHNNLLDVWLIGRKYEWIRDYPALLRYKFFQSFKSLNEAKVFLEFDFLSDKDFYQMFVDGSTIPVLFMSIKAKNKSNVPKLIKVLDYEAKQLLKDYLHICEEKDYEVEIPAGKGSLREIHDAAIWKARQEDAENYSKLEVYDGKDCNFEKEWAKLGISFERLKSPYKMFEVGAKQQFCLGTNYYGQLHNYSFYTIIDGGKEYQIQISPEGKVIQFHGYKNVINPPQELREKLTKDIDLKHSIIKTMDFRSDEYPKVQTDRKEIDEILEPEGEDYDIW